MTTADIVRCRLANQQISQTRFKKPGEIVAWMGAMQAQEYGMAKWAIGLRLQGVNDADVEQALSDGTIVRTHLLRPTWHFVAPADIRWMLALTAPRVKAVSAYMWRQLELDEKIFRRSNDILVKELQGGKHLTRPTLKAALEKKKIVADGNRMSHFMMRAELDGIVCSGARQGKQFTYALLDEVLVANKVPAKTIDREEALAELTKRYFTSHGPATLKDFSWWSGLTMKDAKEGVAMLKPDFTEDEMDGQKYIFKPATSKNNSVKQEQKTFLMPDYDEYCISYKNRSALFNPAYGSGGNSYSHWIVLDGQIAGTWQRIVNKKTIDVETTFFSTLKQDQYKAVQHAIKRYQAFVS